MAELILIILNRKGEYCSFYAVNASALNECMLLALALQLSALIAGTNAKNPANV